MEAAAGSKLLTSIYRRGTPNRAGPRSNKELVDYNGSGLEVHSLSADLDGYELDCQRPPPQSICRCELFCSDSGRI